MKNALRLLSAGLIPLGMLAVGCSQGESVAVEQSNHALSVSSANLTLQDQSNSCGSNQSQTFFKVTNSGSSPVTVSDISIKYWVYDTSGSKVVPQVTTGGCLLDAKGSCVHQVSGVTASATMFSPACGSDANHQANWEITISNSDPTSLGAGLTWSNVQATLQLASWGNFAPGTRTWYTTCAPATSFSNAVHSAVYSRGNLVTAATGVAPACRAPHGTQQLAGHVPPSFDSALVGPLPGATQLTVGVALPVVNPAGLDTFIQQVSDPTSPTYQKFLSPSEFAAAYGLAQTDYNAVINFAGANGLTVASTYNNRSFVLLKGSASAFENAFFVTLNVYKRADGTSYYAPANQPSLNLTVPVASLTGLNNFGKVKHHTGGGGTGPVGCFDGSRGSYAGKDFRDVYFPGCSTDGAGQTVGLFEMGDYYDNDITDYNAAFALAPSGSLTRVALNAGGTRPALDAMSPTGTCAGLPNYFFTPNPANCRSTGSLPVSSPSTLAYGNDGSEVEVALDIEMLMAMVPGANIRVYEANTGNSEVDALTILHAMANDDYVKSLSSSWAWATFAPNPAVATVFQQFAAQGQSFFEASGDSGAYVAGGPQPAVWEPIVSTSLVTVVGGTQLSTTGTSTYSAETVWNDSASCGATACNSVSGGGLVTGYTVCVDQTTNVWTYPNAAPAGACCSTGCTVCCSSTPYPTLAIPTYQSGMPAYLKSSTALSATTRMIPDVSMVAGNLAVFADYVGTAAATYSVYGPLEQCSGGTSAAAPLWAGVTAMLNQKLAALGKPPIGFANPLIYTIASAAQATYNGDFYDVTTGDNHFSGNTTTPGSYAAAAGYDLATGLGTPRCALVNEIVSRIAPSCYDENWGSYAKGTALASVPGWTVSGGPSAPYVLPESGADAPAVVDFGGPAGSIADFAGKTFTRPLDLRVRFHFGSYSGLTFTLNAGADSPATTGYSVSVGDNPSPGVSPAKSLVISKLGGTAVASQSFDVGTLLTETSDNLELSVTANALNVVLNGTALGGLTDSEFASGKLEIVAGTLGDIVVGEIRVAATGCTP